MVLYGIKHAHMQTLNFFVLYSVLNTIPNHYFQKDFRVQELPLARIKKIMKLDEDVKVRGLPKLHFWFYLPPMITWMPYRLTDDVP